MQTAPRSHPHVSAHVEKAGTFLGNGMSCVEVMNSIFLSIHIAISVAIYRCTIHRVHNVPNSQWKVHEEHVWNVLATLCVYLSVASSIGSFISFDGIFFSYIQI